MRTAGSGMRAVRCSLRCYPVWWRQRYGAEQEELAEELAGEGRPHWLLAAGLLAGAVRARMTGSGMPQASELWSSRARASVVVGTVPAALALPLELAFWGAISEHGWSGPGSAAVRLSGAGVVVQWELTALFFAWLMCAAQLLVAGSHLVQGLRALASGRRLTTAAMVAAPVAAVVLGIVMIWVSGSLRPVVSSWERNLITGATHLHYLRRGNPMAATALLWAGWAVAIGGWAVGLLALGRATARSNLSAGALEGVVSNARGTALTQGTFMLGLVALTVTMALQAPISANGGLIYVSRLGPLAVPVLVMLTAIAALSVSGAASARKASAQRGRLRSQPAGRA
jgi:hypothetical protein